MQTTLYLKYRPVKVADLDLMEVKEMMSKLLSGAAGGNMKKLPHAWLFSGPRGTGKTSTARILAKALNCSHKKGFEPCNECEMCREITAGTAIDVIEIDAASNRGIDEIRELKEKIKLAPMRALVKVYIIDEVHMLTTEAANALLKTLEEPPESTFFILCTTEPERLPETVVSRCTRVVFRKPSTDEAVGSLMRVAKGEGMKTEKEALELLVRAARGSFRDGTKFLEQVWLSAGEVTTESVSQVLGMVTEGEAQTFADLVEEGKVKEALAVIEKLESQGSNLRRFVEAVVEVWRGKLLLLASDGKYKEAAVLLERLSGLDQVYEQMKTSVLPQLPIEMFVIESCRRASGGATSGEKSEPAEKPGEEVKAAAGKEKVEAEVEKAEIKPAGSGKLNLSDLEGKWNEVLKAVRPKNHSVEALLRSTRPVAFDGDKLELEVFYKFHKDKLETEKCRLIVETAVGEVFSIPAVKLYLKLGPGRKKKAEEVTAEGVGQDIVAAAEQIFGAETV